METSNLLNLLWVMVATGSVLFMQAGFCFVEAGSVRSKNSINVAVKNFADFCLATVTFWMFGFAIMFASTGSFSSMTFFSDISSPGLVAFFAFQVVFCGTASTIMSGAVAERTTFWGYLITALLISSVIYPVFGHWAWNGGVEGKAAGWLNSQGFVDFAGSSVVHSVGGWASLAACIVIGPRLGRFNKTLPPIQGHNIPMATVGTLILWFGWFGFNGGSTLRVDSTIPTIIVNTNLAASFGALSMLVLTWYLKKKPEVKHILNGALAGLVSITACCNSVLPFQAAIIGIGGGLIYYLGCSLLERWQVDDVVGAVSVHGFCGAYGTLCVGLFSDQAILATGLSATEQLLIQAQGVIICFFWSFVPTFLFLKLMNRIKRLRVSPEDEYKGLNITEHDASTEVIDLLYAMEVQKREGDFSKRVAEEPHTEVGQIANEYNQVLDKVSDEITQRNKKNDELATALQQLKETQAQLVESEKMASLGGLVAGIAHEVNTPIGIGVTMITHLRKKTDEFTEAFEAGKLSKDLFENYIATANESITILNTNLDRASELIKSFKKISVDQSCDEARDIKLKEYINDIITSLKPEYKQYNISFDIECDEDLTFHSYPGAITQVLTNLILNSLKHGFENKENCEIYISANRVNDRISIRYEDNGIGLSDEVKQKIFEPFFTTKRSQGGSGLGMNIVYNTVSRTLKGGIECCEPQRSGGAAFSIYLTEISAEDIDNVQQ